jgi:hypothetical protein
MPDTKPRKLSLGEQSYLDDRLLRASKQGNVKGVRVLLTAQSAMSCMTSAAVASPRVPLSCCKTIPRGAVTVAFWTEQTT